MYSLSTKMEATLRLSINSDWNGERSDFRWDVAGFVSGGVLAGPSAVPLAVRYQ